MNLRMALETRVWACQIRRPQPRTLPSSLLLDQSTAKVGDLLGLGGRSNPDTIDRKIRLNM